MRKNSQPKVDYDIDKNNEEALKIYHKVLKDGKPVQSK